MAVLVLVELAASLLPNFGEEKEGNPLLAKKHQIRCQWRMAKRKGFGTCFLKLVPHSKSKKSNQSRERDRRQRTERERAIK